MAKKADAAMAALPAALSGATIWLIENTLIITDIRTLLLVSRRP
jgi:hypothetical protein